GAPAHRALHAFPTRRSSDLRNGSALICCMTAVACWAKSGYLNCMSCQASRAASCALLTASACCLVFSAKYRSAKRSSVPYGSLRSEEHTSELQSRENLVCRL